MIDKRAKNAASPRRHEDPRKGKQPRQPRSDHAAAATGVEKPRRAARPATEAKTGKPELHRRPKPRKQDARPARDEEAGMRIAKVMARAGLCSRRDAETWIAEGRVFLNGKVLTTPAINVGPQDQVSVDGAALAERERTRLFLFHKPRGLVTTEKDPEGRQTIFDYLHQNWPDGPRVISVGRLDINTEGLLLLTNDGGLARVLELPSTGWMRRYRVRANGKTDQSILDRLRDGLTVDGVDYAGIDATLDRVQGDNVWLSLGLREGKNREIKRVLEHLGLYVNRLIRVSFGPFQLGELAEGKVEEVRTRVLRDQLGPALANEADADFESPLAEPQKEPTAPPPPARARKPLDERSRGGPRHDSKPARSRDDRPARGETQRAGRDAPRAKPADQKSSATRSGGPRQRKTGPEAREASAPVEPSFKPRGPRKHISAMRATTPNPERGERKRSFLSETADRKGRAVVVERKAKVAPRKTREDPAPERDDVRKSRAPARAHQNARPGRPQSASTRTEDASTRASRPTSRFKTQEPASASSKPRHAGKPSARQETAEKPARDARPTGRKPSADGRNGAGARSRDASAKDTRPKDTRPKGTKPAAGRPASARPVKPGRPQRPR